MSDRDVLDVRQILHRGAETVGHYTRTECGLYLVGKVQQSERQYVRCEACFDAR